jgi:hypothetical protein
MTGLFVTAWFSASDRLSPGKLIESSMGKKTVSKQGVIETPIDPSAPSLYRVRDFVDTFEGGIPLGVAMPPLEIDTRSDLPPEPAPTLNRQPAVEAEDSPSDKPTLTPTP